MRVECSFLDVGRAHEGELILALHSINRFVLYNKNGRIIAYCETTNLSFFSD